VSVVPPTRVVLAIPPILRDIVKGIVAGEAGLTVVDEVAEGDDLVAATRASDADFVIAGLRDGELSPACVDLLAQNSRVRLLAVSGDGRSASLYALRPEVQALGELSPRRLVWAIRSGGDGGGRS
jgi:DNA-binding NarL/FixJ family response regulator